MAKFKIKDSTWLWGGLAAVVFTLFDIPITSAQFPAVRAVNIKGDIPRDPAADVWEQATPLTSSLSRGQRKVFPWGGGKVNSITIRSLRNDREIGFLLEWEDPVADRHFSATTYADAVALQFSNSDSLDECMGQKDSHVNIWHWRADRDGQQPQQMERFADYYTDFEFPYQPRRRPVEDLAANGYGGLASLPLQAVDGGGVYKDGKWSVVMLRSLDPGESVGAINLTQDEARFVAFAAFDGGKGEGGAKHSASNWFEFIAEK